MDHAEKAADSSIGRFLPQVFANPHRLGLVVGAFVFSAALITLYVESDQVSWADIRASVATLSLSAFALAALGTAISYAALSFYDVLALRHEGETGVPPRWIFFTSFVANVFTFMLGFGLLSGGAVRLRFYGAKGVRPAQVVRISLIGTGAFWLGLIGAAALALVFLPTEAGRADRLAQPFNIGLGLALLAALGAWLAFCGAGERRVGFAGRDLRLPSARFQAAGLLLGCIDAAAAAFALYMLIPAASAPHYADVLAVFVVATALSVVSNVPGGLGVFEATFLLAFPDVDPGALVGALIAFRVIYFLAPFGLALALVTGREIYEQRHLLGRTVVGSARLAAPLIPQIAAVLVFLGGAVLLASGALPAEHDRLHVLRHVVPLPFVEGSHLFGSVVGVVLLVLASGLAQRLAAAWRASIVLLLAGAVFSLFKGLDYEEALICAVIAGILAVNRKAFYRRAGNGLHGLSIEFFIGLAVVLAASIWLGFIAFRDVEYDSVLWWQFAYRDDASRFLRATLAAAVLAIGIGAYVLVHRSARPLARKAGAIDPAIAAMADQAARTDARLAFLGDKSFLRDESGDGFLMYGVYGRSIVFMGDPVAADPERVRALIWKAKEFADKELLAPVFYQITTEHLPLYLDAGFSLVKLGEEAWVDLKAFTLDGGEGRRLRQSLTRAKRQGLTFELVPAARIDSVLDDMREVSDAWLAEKGGREKGFSLGFWSETYMRRYDAVLVRHEGKLVAFANLWRGGAGVELSVDLMRHEAGAPSGAMDMMFIELMLLGKAEGFSWFNLGMAPLAGLPEHRLANAWARAAGFIYRQGDRFYNFEGLRAFKQKFKPIWRPKYLAYIGGLSLPQTLFDCSRLIATAPKRAGLREGSKEDA